MFVILVAIGVATLMRQEAGGELPPATGPEARAAGAEQTMRELAGKLREQTRGLTREEMLARFNRAKAPCEERFRRDDTGQCVPASADDR